MIRSLLISIHAPRPGHGWQQRAAAGGLALSVATQMLFATIVFSAMSIDSRGAERIDWVYEKQGRTWLFGGHGEGQDFDITDLTLDHRKLSFGFGREAFPALNRPELGRTGEEGVRVEGSTRVIALVIGGEARTYPLERMRHHETVNDVVGGRPVLVAYCTVARSRSR